MQTRWEGSSSDKIVKIEITENKAFKAENNVLDPNHLRSALTKGTTSRDVGV